MNDEQYRQLRDNARRQYCAPLNDSTTRETRRNRRRRDPLPPPMAQVIAQAAQQLRTRDVTEAAWERIADPAWLPFTALRVPERGQITILVANSALLYELRRQRPRLERQFAAQLPHPVRLTFVISDENGENTGSATHEAS